MSRRNTTRLGILGILLVGFVLGYIAACSNTQPTKPVAASQADNAKPDEKPQQEAQRPPTISPTKATANRDVYFPGTEDLEPDEMRVTALGTGMPSARPKQAAACFLVELGNGDKFLFGQRRLARTLRRWRERFACHQGHGGRSFRSG